MALIRRYKTLADRVLRISVDSQLDSFRRLMLTVSSPRGGGAEVVRRMAGRPAPFHVRRASARLVAADAPRLAGHDMGERTHRLAATALLIQQLEIHRPHRRHLERDAAVRFDRHGAENLFGAFVVKERSERLASQDVPRERGVLTPLLSLEVALAA